MKRIQNFISLVFIIRFSKIFNPSDLFCDFLSFVEHTKYFFPPKSYRGEQISKWQWKQAWKMNGYFGITQVYDISKKS